MHKALNTEPREPWNRGGALGYRGLSRRARTGPSASAEGRPAPVPAERFPSAALGAARGCSGAVPGRSGAGAGGAGPGPRPGPPPLPAGAGRAAAAPAPPDVRGGGGGARLRAGSRHGPGVLRRRGQLHRLQRGPRRAQQRLLRGCAQRGAARLLALHHLPHPLHRWVPAVLPSPVRLCLSYLPSFSFCLSTPGAALPRPPARLCLAVGFPPRPARVPRSPRPPGLPLPCPPAWPCPRAARGGCAALGMRCELRDAPAAASPRAAPAPPAVRPGQRPRLRLSGQPAGLPAGETPCAGRAGTGDAGRDRRICPAGAGQGAEINALLKPRKPDK